jgi:hypothetical protein
MKNLSFNYVFKLAMLSILSPMWRVEGNPINFPIEMKELFSFELSKLNSIFLIVFGLIIILGYSWKRLFKLALYYSGVISGIMMIFYGIFLILHDAYSTMLVNKSKIEEIYINFISELYEYIKIISPYLLGIVVGGTMSCWGNLHAYISGRYKANSIKEEKHIHQQYNNLSTYTGEV